MTRRLRTPGSYTADEDAALCAYVAAHPKLKPTGMKIWTEAAAAGVTTHSHHSMRDRYVKARARGAALCAALRAKGVC